MPNDRLHSDPQKRRAFRLDGRAGRGACSELERAVTQSELAAHLGTMREVVAKLLRRMVADRLIQTGRGTIRVARREALARLLGTVAG
ncbi:MAG TPA: hypothetical protein DFK12_03535 [Gallionellaceae bacterium]|nr:hypothetical protein [Gallionellaceae bacterium]